MAIMPPKSSSRASPADDSPVLGKLMGPPSLVARRERPWGLVLGLIGVAVVGLIVFSSMSQDRQARAQAPLRPVSAVMTPAVATLSTMPAMPEPSTQPVTALPSAPAPVDPNVDPATRWKAPAMVVDMGQEGGQGASSPLAQAGAGAPRAGQAPGEAGLSPDERFEQKASSSAVETASATRLTDTALIAPQGTVIPAVMETAMNLDLPGYARAVVSRDVRGFDGSTVLIPRGSQLIGQYRAGVAAGQSRAFVVWSRVLTPDGISVDIGSPAADRLGESGIQGETNTHFLRRFGNAILLSVINAGLQVAANTTSNNSTTAIAIGSQQQATNIAAIALQKEIDIPDTVTVAQGAPIRVFVARDLDFSSVVRKAQ